ncbi:ABC transporter substrate-binding protein [Micromonospora fluostatini]|uniref:ABC transporter substrate-binding protein n=1 Tax=Micromonospora sp. JCM 30529 TaxID=3421643 RepID=UPI003D164020
MATATNPSAALTRRSVLALGASSLLLGACGQEPPGDPGSAAPDGPELLIGASLELTGRGAALGVLQERALRITVEQLDADGVPVGDHRRRVRVDVRDNTGDARVASQHAAEFAAREDVCAMLGGTLAETSTAIAETAQQQRIPFLSLASGDGIVQPTAGRTYVYKLTPDADDVARRLAELVRDQGLRQVALLASDGLHGRSGRQAMRAALRAADVGLSRTGALPATGLDVAAAVRRLTADADRPDGVVVWAGSPDAASAARELRRSGYDGPLFFDATAVTEETLDNRNVTTMEGAYVVHPACLDESTLTNTTTAALARRDFVFRYIERHGAFSGFAPYASDAVRLVADAAGLARSADRGRLRAFLEQQVTEGIAGAYAFSPERHGGMEQDSLGVYTVSRGDWTRVS